MKLCAVCSANLDGLEAPALLFIGKYGRHYELCKSCEQIMDKLVAEDSTENERRGASDYLYQHLFYAENGRTSAEVVDFFKNALTDKDRMQQLNENRLQSLSEAEDETDTGLPDEENEDTGPVEPTHEVEKADEEKDEENALSQEAEKTSLSVKLAFLAVYLVIGGSLLAYGIVKGAVLAIVIAVLVLLFGAAAVFSKD